MSDPNLALLGVAIIAGDLAQLRALARAGTDLNQEFGKGGSLHFAVSVWPPGQTESSRSPVVEELLRLGAELNARNQEGATPLDMALAGGKSQIARVLREAGATSANPPSGSVVSQLEKDVFTGIEAVQLPPLELPGPAGSGGWTSLAIAGALSALLFFGLSRAGLISFEGQLMTDYCAVNTSKSRIKVTVKGAEVTKEVEVPPGAGLNFSAPGRRGTLITVAPSAGKKAWLSQSLEQSAKGPIAVKVGDQPVAAVSYRGMYETTNKTGEVRGYLIQARLEPEDVVMLKQPITFLETLAEDPIELGEMGEPLPREIEPRVDLIRLEILSNGLTSEGKVAAELSHRVQAQLQKQGKKR